VAVVGDASAACVQRLEEDGTANVRLLDDEGLRVLLQRIAGRLPHPAAVGIGVAGVLDAGDRDRVRAAAACAWPGIPCWAGSDLESAFAAASGPLAARSGRARVIVISGTGAACYGVRHDGREVLTGGWGHVAGDRGGGCDIARRALGAVFAAFDESGRWPALGRRVIRSRRLDSPTALVAWAGAADKATIAALAIDVFAAAARRDRIALAVLEDAAQSLARAAIACARRISRKDQLVEFVLTGGILQKQSRFRRDVGRRLEAGCPGASVRILDREAAWGALELGRRQQEAPSPAPLSPRRGPPDRRRATLAAGHSGYAIPRSSGLSPTEERHPLSRDLDRMSVPSAIRLMLAEDAALPAALRSEEKAIASAVRLISSAFRRGGRLFYVGAGTSGRLGALDASECPPTFNVPPEMAQAIVAGGDRALNRAQEGAEDDVAAGAEAVRQRGVGTRDVVVGIAASGRTPFVWGALGAARELGARTVLVCFNPNLVFDRGTRPTLVVAPRIGPEILTGSTRLKAGTATKLLLNIFTTLSMVQLGKVVQNLMVDMQPTNAKLRDRAVRIVQALTGVAYPVAEEALARRGWSIQATLPDLKPGRRPRRQSTPGKR